VLLAYIVIPSIRTLFVVTDASFPSVGLLCFVTELVISYSIFQICDNRWDDTIGSVCLYIYVLAE